MAGRLLVSRPLTQRHPHRMQGLCRLINDPGEPISQRRRQVQNSFTVKPLSDNRVMAMTIRFNVLCFAIIAIGMLLSLFAAIMPYYPPAYQLRLSVLITGWIPYLVFGLPAALLRRTITPLAGAFVMLVHLLAVLVTRGAVDANTVHSALYWVPLGLATLLIPLAVAAVREPWHR